MTVPAMFDEFFSDATGCAPLPFQQEFAQSETLPQLVNIPTGLGKTAMGVVGWLWRRFGGQGKLRAVTPRRLVYCLPMRVLVEQTAKNAREWVSRLQKAGRLLDDVRIYMLMGGENEEQIKAQDADGDSTGAARFSACQGCHRFNARGVFVAEGLAATIEYPAVREGMVLYARA